MTPLDKTVASQELIQIGKKETARNLKSYRFYSFFLKGGNYALKSHTYWKRRNIQSIGNTAQH
ncbi:Uncharacterized protein dnm_079860 [Desulfonema magnum]|uniref:Uncharacterized protein n=1 Tax=Desulfonema magnum TaxID=45655 RepID=A0A975BUK2_9BACT|nr:Uncharacterized protein dnm_079860 [Desulfonema magnum]